MEQGNNSSDSDTEHFLGDWYVCKICRHVFKSKELLYEHKRYHFFDYVETASEGTRRKRCAEWVEQTQRYMQNLKNSCSVEEDPLPSLTKDKASNSSFSDPSIPLLDSTFTTTDEDDEAPSQEHINGYTNGCVVVAKKRKVSDCNHPSNTPRTQQQQQRKPQKRKSRQALSSSGPKRKKAGSRKAATAKVVQRQVNPSKSTANYNKCKQTTGAVSRKSPAKSSAARRQSRCGKLAAVKAYRIPREFQIGMDVEVRLKLEDYRLCTDCGKTFLSSPEYAAHFKKCSGSGLQQRRSRRILTKVNPNKTALNGYGQCGKRSCTAC